MEKEIKNIFKIKRELRILYNLEMKYVDLKSNNLIDSETLEKMRIISKIDEDLMTIIIDLQNIKNS